MPTSQQMYDAVAHLPHNDPRRLKVEELCAAVEHSEASNPEPIQTVKQLRDAIAEEAFDTLLGEFAPEIVIGHLQRYIDANDLPITTDMLRHKFKVTISIDKDYLSDLR